MKGEALRGHLELLLLAALAKGPAHGYALIDRLEERSGGVLELTEGSVYPALHRLEQQGYVTSSWTTAEGRRRRTYRVSRRGQAELRARRAAWRDLVSTVDLVLRPA
jgi:PadR family transcriptional regulator, regulatory protein PadR